MSCCRRHSDLSPSWANRRAPYSPYVDADGAISIPPDFREWAYLGAWSVAGDDEAGGAAELHVVYTQPESIEAYRRTGEFQDGAVLVKELFGTDTDDMTTGRVSWAKRVTGWFIMIKDREGRFQGSGLWGDGWGWALLSADDPATTVTEDYRAECIPCHVPAKNGRLGLRSRLPGAARVAIVVVPPTASRAGRTAASRPRQERKRWT